MKKTTLSENAHLSIELIIQFILLHFNAFEFVSFFSMKRGNLSTGKTNSIPFKCTQRGFFDPMEIDIAEEVCDLVTVNGMLCFSAYCIRCDSLMLPEDVLQKISKAE